jgi:NAD(P)H-flavin reductase
MKQFDVKLNSSKKITPNIMHLAFERSDGEPLTYVPGQFVTFLIDSEDGMKRRSYSIATIPGSSSETEIAISYLKHGIASNTMFNLQPGETLTCSGPFGRLILRENEAPARYILVATGTGVAPYRAMLPQIAERLAADENLQIVLLLGVQYRADLLYGQDFIDFAAKHERFEFRAYLSRDELEDAQPYEYKGYVQTAFANLSINADDDLVYLCGNPNMIDQAFEYLTDEGFSPRNVRREKYISSN